MMSDEMEDTVMSFLWLSSIRKQRCQGSIAGLPAIELPALYRCKTALRC